MPNPTIPDASERTVRVGSSEIFVSSFGAGPPLVLLHGGGPGASGLTNFSRNITELAANHRVIVPDLPGYGRSSKHINQSDPFGFLANTIRDLMDALEVPSAHLAGNSYGGACALRLALDTPDRVGKLVLMGPGGIGTTRRLPTAGLNSVLNYYRDGQPSRERLAHFIREYLVYEADSVPDDLIDLRFEASIDPEVMANPPLRRPSGLGAARTVWRMDFTRDRRLTSLSTPTLILWGRDDKVNRPSGGQMLIDRMPNADLVVTARTGHWVQWERPELFNRLVADFLDEHTTVATP